MIGPVVDTPTQFDALVGWTGDSGVFGGGPIPFVIGDPGSDWLFSFTFTEVNGGFGIHDRVIVDGTIQHQTHPHSGDTGATAPLPLSITFEADADIIGIPVIESFALHPDVGHGDFASIFFFGIATAARDGDPGLDLTEWDVRFSASHIPEPSTLALLSSGILGLLGCWRRYRTAERYRGQRRRA